MRYTLTIPTILILTLLQSGCWRFPEDPPILTITEAPATKHAVAALPG